jgi:Mg2+-importing ATPase
MAFPIPLQLRHVGVDDPVRRETVPAREGDGGRVPPEFWRSTAPQILAMLRTSERGLSSAEARSRLASAGPNTLFQKTPRRLIVDLARRVGNPLVLMLLAASVVAGATGEMTSFVMIVAMVFLSTVLDTIQERRAEATAAALRESIALVARTLRDGAAVPVSVQDLVPGDIVLLSAGDLVPADGIVLCANSAQVNQAALTGEPFPVEKTPHVEPGASMTEARNLLLHGSSMIGGSATMLVVQTGDRTHFGGIARSLGQEQPPTAFERGIHKLGLLIVRMTIFLVLFVILAHLALGRPPVESFLFAMALAVGLTPELLPMVMTIGLARGAQRMAQARVVVKRLSAIHDLGEMDILCTDKTGTLTEARIMMTGHPGIDGTDSERVFELAAVNARFESGLRSPLDDALLAHTGHHPLTGWRKLDERPFDFERRRVSVLAEWQGKRVEIVKGAPEAILGLCSQAEAADGTIVPLDAALKTQLARLHDDNASQGLRLLGIAWKAAQGRDRIETDDDDHLTFAGYCLFLDPPKNSAAAAIARLEAKGVHTKVISGDAAPAVQHLMTALERPASHLLTGDEIAALDDSALAVRVTETDLFARVTPDQKLRIVRALQARGHVVGFLGDGINDAPAIRAADVGLSVDGATDVAREAADMILLAPDLAVLAAGVTEGRRTYANILKYIRMGTSSNFGNMLTMALASLFLPFLPLTPVQILLNNMLYDLSQTGIPFDSAESGDLASPRGWDMRALVRFTVIMGPLSSLFDIATFAALIALFHVDVPTFRTAWFMESMATQILVVFVIRTSAPMWRQHPHRLLVATASLCLASAIALPFLPIASALGFTAPAFPILAVTATLVAAYLLSAEGMKRLIMR